ncbi:hypothetical protein EV645_6468 [Kribbella rubisoli]|uniref:Uncharacterized protein n=1 Tax=Kribbella rubisoli TaxID=3075929 RepID=A0A4V2FWW3_9ACTN|nr:hypothetical protein EV645_6468 [Kribbella rubisoli]
MSFAVGSPLYRHELIAPVTDHGGQRSGARLPRFAAVRPQVTPVTELGGAGAELTGHGLCALA